MDTYNQILAILRHYPELGLKSTEVVHRIAEVKGKETISNHSAQKTGLSVLTHRTPEINYKI